MINNRKLAGGNALPLINVSHIGNAGSRCQHPVYKVREGEVDYTFVPATREATFIFEQKKGNTIQRQVINVRSVKILNALAQKIESYMLSLRVTIDSKGGAI